MVVGEEDGILADGVEDGNKPLGPNLARHFVDGNG